MKKLYLYMIKKFIGPFVAIFFICTFVLLMQFLWRYLEDIIGKGLDNSIIIEVMFYAICNLVPMSMPLAVLISSIMTFGNLGEDNELLAMKAAGISLYKIISPIAILSILISLGAFYFSNDILPVTNRKLQSLLWSVKTQRPEILVKEGAFSNDIDGFSIKVAEKSDSGTLLDVLIYDHRDNKANSDVIVADSAYMNISPDKRNMVLTLFQGEHYSEKKADKRADRKKRPFQRDVFSKQIIVTPIQGLDFERTNEDRFKNNYKTISLNDLEVSADSLNLDIERRAEKYLGMMRFNSSLAAQLKVLGRADSIRSRIGRDSVSTRSLDIDTIYANMKLDLKKRILISSVAQAKENSKSLILAEKEISGIQEWQRRYWIEWHRKLTLSLACLIFFFIGAPLGGIIRKGGLGFPIVISILVFIFYYIIGLIVEKSAREGIMSPMGAMWLTSYLFGFAGVLLTIRVANDQSFKGLAVIFRVFEKINYKRLISKLPLRDKNDKEMKHLTVKQIKQPNSLVEAKTLLLSMTSNRISVLNWKREFPFSPDVNFRIAHDKESFYIFYEVKGERMRAVNVEPNSEVYEDSCCEFFFAPDAYGYYNIEINAIGTILMGYGADGSDRKRLDPVIFKDIEVLPSVGTEKIESTDDYREWSLTVKIPFSVFTFHPDIDVVGEEFKANFYKCGDKTPEAHFVSWSAIDTESPSFHQPGFFGTIDIE